MTSIVHLVTSFKSGIEDHGLEILTESGVMRIYLFAVLLGCFVVSGFAQRETFQFNDSQGRCWICSPGAPCSPCQDQNSQSSQNIMPFPQPPLTHPRSCPAPNCNNAAVREILWPSPDPRIFIQCGPCPICPPGNWAAAEVECQCGTYFDYEMQRCESPWDWVPWCSPLMNPLPPPRSCDDPDEELPTQLPPEPTTEPPTTDAPTLPPCQCIPWIPCWCQPNVNPCWNMPCGRCGGCMG